MLNADDNIIEFGILNLEYVLYKYIIVSISDKDMYLKIVPNYVFNK